MLTRQRTFPTTLALLAAAAFLAAPAAAQEQEGEEREGGERAATAKGPYRGAMGDMHRMHAMRAGHGAMLAHVPAAILHQRGMLGLSDQQVSRLETLRDSVRTLRESGHAAMREAHGGDEGAFGEGGIDVEAYREAVRAAADRMVEHGVAMATVARDALQVLDTEQREKFVYGVHLMQRMRAHHGRGMGMMGARHEHEKEEAEEHEHEDEDGEGGV